MRRRSWRDAGALQPRFAVWGALTVLAGLAASPIARAESGATEQPLSSAIEVLTLNPCLERAPLLDEIETWLERDTVDARLHVKIGEENGFLRFSIALGGGERMTHEFPDLPPDCEGQRRAMALSVALAIDAIAPEAGSRRSAPSGSLSAYGLVTTSLPDRLAWGGGLLARVAVSPSFWPSVGGFVAVAPGQTLGVDLPLRFDTWLVAARAEGCFLLPGDSGIFWSACAGPWIGALTTRSQGLPDAGSDTELWGALAAALELHVQVTRAWGFHAGVDVLVSAHRSQVQVNGNEGNPAIQEEFPRVMGMLRLGPEVFF